MNKKPTWLLDYKFDTYSQTGEDGIIQKILKELPERDKWCVEFGAYDGQNLSNVCNLIENSGYSAVLIEGSQRRFVDLQKKYSNQSHVTTMNRFVGLNEDDRLDRILSETQIPINFDFLSIDVDGIDYHIWKSLAHYAPKVVCIEFNPTIPNEIDFVQPSDASINTGSGLLSIVKLAGEKGYELVSVLRFNAIFVKSEYFPIFEIENNKPEVLRTDTSRITYLFSGFDGSVYLYGFKRLPWHDIDFRHQKVQQLPALFRGFPDRWNRFKRIAFKFYKFYLDILKRLRPNR